MQQRMTVLTLVGYVLALGTLVNSSLDYDSINDYEIRKKCGLMIGFERVQ